MSKHARRVAVQLALVLAFVGLLAASMFISSVCHQRQQPTGGQWKSDQRQDASHDVPMARGAIEPSTGLNDQPQATREERGAYADALCEVFDGTTATDRVIAITTLAYLLVTIWMLQAIRRQADLAHQSVRAAIVGVQAAQSNVEATHEAIHVSLDNLKLTAQSIQISERSAAAAEQAARISERALVELERPWVLVSHATVRHLRDQWLVMLTFKNCGRGPAFDVVVTGDWATTPPQALPEPSTDAINRADPMVLGPSEPGGTETPIGHEPSPGYFFGKITYRDQFDRHHPTWFCLYFTVFADGAGGTYRTRFNRAE